MPILAKAIRCAVTTAGFLTLSLSTATPLPAAGVHRGCQVPSHRHPAVLSRAGLARDKVLLLRFGP